MAPGLAGSGRDRDADRGRWRGDPRTAPRETGFRGAPAPVVERADRQPCRLPRPGQPGRSGLPGSAEKADAAVRPRLDARLGVSLFRTTDHRLAGAQTYLAHSLAAGRCITRAEFLSPASFVVSWPG